MYEKTVRVNNTDGLHAKAAAFLIQAATEFQSAITIQKQDRTANGKSLLGVFALGVDQGDEVTIIAQGADEVQAVERLESLL